MNTALATAYVLFGATGPQLVAPSAPRFPGLVAPGTRVWQLDRLQQRLRAVREERERYERRKGDYRKPIEWLRREEQNLRWMIESASKPSEPRPWMPTMPPAQLPERRPRPKVWD